MASVSEKRMLVGFDDLGIPDWTPVEFLTFSREIKLCSLCSVVSPNTASVACNHVLCSFCFRQQEEGPTIVCPLDKVETATSKVKFERNNTDLLMSLRVTCVNRRNGCRLLDTLRGMKEHLKQCEFQAVQCQMCGKKIKLHEVPGHARKDCSRIPKSDNSKRTAAQAGSPARATNLQKPTGEQPMAVGAMQSPTLQTVQSPGMPPQIVMQPVPMVQHQMMAQHVQAAQQPPIVMQQGPRFEEITMLQQKVNKVSEEVRKMAAKIQAMKDETARDLEVIKKDVQKLRNEKGDQSVLVNAISGLRNQMKADMVDVAEEFDAIKEDMRIYGASIENLATLRDTIDHRIGDVVMNVESLKDSMEGYAMLSTTVAEMKSSIVAIQDMKHVMEFVNDFEETLLGDITGSSGDKKKAFTQQIEMLKKCVEVIDELKSTVKHKDMEQVVNDLTTIKHDLDKYSALHDKVEGIVSDLAGMKEVMKDTGDLAKGDNALIEKCCMDLEKCCMDLEKCAAEIKLLQETVQKTDSTIAQMRTSVEDTKNKDEFAKIATEISGLKTKLEDYDLVKESLQLTKDAAKRIDTLSEDLNNIREKMLEFEKIDTKSGDSEKKMDEITVQLSNLQTTNDDIRRLQVSLQTLNKRFNRKAEELQASFEAAITEKIEASKGSSELAELQASLTEVKKDVQLLSELKESLSGKHTAKEGALEDIVKDMKEIKASIKALQESSTSQREKMKRYDELRNTVDAIKEDMKGYQELKTNFDSLRKTVDKKLKTTENKD